MASYTIPTTQSAGALITASVWNTDLVENIKYLKDATATPGAITLSTVAPSTPTAYTLYKDSIVSAWADLAVAGGTPSITDDVNVASVTDNGTGDTTVTFATAIGVTSYAAVAAPRANSNRIHASCYSFASGSVRVYTYNDAADAAADADVSLIVVGA